MKKILKNDFTTLLMRLILLYVLWGLCRVVFYLQNMGDLGEISGEEFIPLLRGSFAFDTASIFYINSLFILLSLLPFRFRENRGYQTSLSWLFIVVNTIGLIINISDGVYFHYAKKRFTSDELSYLDNNDNNASVMMQAVTENWLVLLFGLCVIAALIFGYRKIKYHPTQIKNRYTYFGVNLLLLCIGCALVIGGIRGGFGSSRPITLSNATIYTKLSTKANLILSNPFCMIRTMDNKSISYKRFYTPEQLDSLYQPYHYPDSSLVNLKGRNVVIFILESFSSEHSALLNPDLYPDGKGHTPFLDSLMREGFYFQNAFSSGRKSIDALPSVLSSIPSYQTPFILMPQSVAKMGALPEILDSKGYSSSFFNGSEYGSMGFGAYMNLAGVESYYCMDDYVKIYGKDDYDGWWGIWDEPFLQYMEQMLSKTPEPFLSTVFTLTSHHPFRIPAQYENIFPEGRTKVHKCVEYSDFAIRQFFASARKEKWFDNTIFVFVGDHVSSETFAKKTLTPTGNSQVISFIYTPDGAVKGKYTPTVSQIDLMPTILGLLGHDQPYFAFGRDVINETEKFPLSINFVNQNYQGISDSMVLFFDGEQTLSAFSRTDTLQQHDLTKDRTPYFEKVEEQIKMRVQQYYRHVEQSDYLVKPPKN